MLQKNTEEKGLSDMKKGFVAPQEDWSKLEKERKKAKETGETLKESIIKNIKKNLMDPKKY